MICYSYLFVNIHSLAANLFSLSTHFHIIRKCVAHTASMSSIAKTSEVFRKLEPTNREFNDTLLFSEAWKQSIRWAVKRISLIIIRVNQFTNLQATQTWYRSKINWSQNEKYKLSTWDSHDITQQSRLCYKKALKPRRELSILTSF